MGSSAADSQLAAAMSQLRFQSAAFSSSLQTATKPTLDQNNKNNWRWKKYRKIHKKRRVISVFFWWHCSEETVTGATFVPQQCGSKKTKKGRLWGSAGPDKFNSTIAFQTALPTDLHCFHKKVTWTVQSCLYIPAHLVPGSRGSFQNSKQPSSAHLNSVNHTHT